ncbi:uncharacterized protein LOC129094669 [Anoplopoma fimbria]|uniref:uncharacterized protein LOC129094669 n=1 Tax=Anoplopoma fimbria TaxID=229290 RepID=UPI0023EC6C94|nr:uncharacterized protein LOC129094669 [Anoplopoma fimbria]
MPNIRQLRNRASKRHRWSKEAMEQAMQEVRAGRQNARQAAEQFGIPKSSLWDRLSGRGAPDYGKVQLLSPEDENSLVEYCLYSASHRCPQRKYQVVAQALALYNYRNPHKPRTVLGQTWWINFRERHHHRLTSHTPDITDHGKKSRSKMGADVPFSPLPPPESPPSSPSSDPFLTHPLVASGRIPVDVARVLSKTDQTFDIEKVRRSSHVLTAQQMSDVIKKVEDSAARMISRSVKRQEAEDTDPAVSSSTLPGGSRFSRKRSLSSGAHPATSFGAAGPSALFVPTSTSPSASIAPSSTPTNMSMSSNDGHHKIVEGHMTAKKKRCEKRILRCGRCRQPYPPKEPEGLVLWVQCDNCHKMFHTICVSSEMDLDDDEFWTCSISQSMTSWSSESTITSTACTFSLLYASSRSETGGEVVESGSVFKSPWRLKVFLSTQP